MDNKHSVIIEKVHECMGFTVFQSLKFRIIYFFPIFFLYPYQGYRKWDLDFLGFVFLFVFVYLGTLDQLPLCN